MSQKALLGAYTICKNEEKSIFETITKNAPFLDHFTILDTGSTDNTLNEIRKAKRTLQRTKGKCEIHLFQEPFIDFATSKNRARSLQSGLTTYEINLDADEFLVGAQHLRTFLTSLETQPIAHDLFHVAINIDNHVFFAYPRLSRFSCKSKFIGVVHEVFDGLSDYSPYDHMVPNFQIFHTTRFDDPQRKNARYLTDIELLEKERERDPANGRTSFYLAQSYFHAKQFAPALAEYTRRTKLGQFAEEVFESYLHIGMIHEFKDRIEPAVKSFMRAYKHSPDRAEPLTYMADIYGRTGNIPMSYLFALAAFFKRVPQRPLLFLNKNAYGFFPAELLARSGYRVADERHGKMGVEKARKLNPCDPTIRVLADIYAKLHVPSHPPLAPDVLFKL